ncbi:MAG: hypothetical protein ACRDFX_09080 [Chloroflexota bacterium]
MTVGQFIREADMYTGDVLGRKVFDEAHAALLAGEDRTRVISMLTSLYQYLGEDGRDTDQDAIADVLDSVTGFCSPRAAV